MKGHGFTGFGSKADLLEGLVKGRSVVHLGAVGETCQPLHVKLAAAPQSVHARLTRSAASCIGVDVDREGVAALTEEGVFSNLLAADVFDLRRIDIPLPIIEFIVAGDIIEHLSAPGDLLDVAARFADPGTKLVLTTPNALGLPNFLRYLKGHALEGPDHKASFNVYTISNLLGHHGWHVEDLKSCHQQGLAVRNPIVRWVGHRMLSRWPSLGGTILVVAGRSR